MAAYQPIQMPGGSGDFMGDVVDRIMRAREASRKAEQDRAELLLNQQRQAQQGQLQAAQIQDYQSKEQQRLAAEAEQKRLGTRQEHLDVATAIPKIRDMLTPGHAGYDPEAGMSLARAYGINLAAQQPQMPEAPTSRPVGPTQVEYGPRISPEDAQQSAILGAKTSPDQPEARADEVMDLAGKAEAERQRFAQANDPSAVAANVQEKGAQDAEQTDYAARLAATKKRVPTYSGTSPIGPVSIDPNAIIAAREEERLRQQKQLAPLTGAADEDFAPVVKSMVDAGMPPSEIAKALADYRRQAATEENKAKYSLTAEDQKRHQRAMEAAAFAAANSRQEAQGARNQEKDDTTTVRDATGTPIGHVPSGRGGAVGFSTRDADYSKAENQLQELLDHVEKHGNRTLDPATAQRRDTLYKGAVIGVATVSPLGKTNESQKLEAENIGPSGAPDMEHKMGVLIGASPEAIKAKIEEIRKQRDAYRAQTLIPLDEKPAPAKKQGRTVKDKLTGKPSKSIDDLVREAGGG